MAKYLLEVNDSLEGIKGVKAKGGSARAAAARELIEGLGGKLESFYFAFGGADAIVVVEMPDNASGVAAAVTVSAGGGATTKTVALITPEEMDTAAKMDATYHPPGS